MELERLQKALEEQGYYIPERLLVLVWSALLVSKGAFLRGPAGSGKTALASALAEALGYKLIFFQAYPGAREEDFLYTLMPDEKTKSGFRLQEGVIVQAVLNSHKEPTLLLIDELDKTHPSCDAFFLDFLQNGRVRFKGETLTAKRENLLTFFTLNYERELSEPLLRRLPTIQVDYLPESLVRKILEKEFEKELVELALEIYRRSIKAGLSKPATVQELRQFLQAVRLLKDKADFDDLVYCFITKTEEQHQLLAIAPPTYKYEERVKLSESFEMTEPLKEEEFKPKMPRLKGFGEREQSNTEVKEEELEIANAVVENTDQGYDALIRLTTTNLNTSDEKLGIETKKDCLIVKERIDLFKYLELMKFAKEQDNEKLSVEGEVLVELEQVGISFVEELFKKGWLVKKLSSNEILLKDTRSGFTARYDKEKKIFQMIAQIDYKKASKAFRTGYWEGLISEVKRYIIKQEQQTQVVEKHPLDELEELVSELTQGFEGTPADAYKVVKEKLTRVAKLLEQLSSYDSKKVETTFEVEFIRKALRFYNAVLKLERITQIYPFVELRVSNYNKELRDYDDKLVLQCYDFQTIRKRKEIAEQRLQYLTTEVKFK